jgi:NADPH:quinone reductase-like Zn-dependent oxidoreductase
MNALPFLRDKARIKRGERVLSVGASGAVGTAAVQIAKHFGAVVTGVTSTGNAALVQSIGADRVIDYTRVDFATTGDTWDIILDTTGTVYFSRSEISLKPGGATGRRAGLVGPVVRVGQAVTEERQARDHRCCRTDAR